MEEQNLRNEHTMHSSNHRSVVGIRIYQRDRREIVATMGTHVSLSECGWHSTNSTTALLSVSIVSVNKLSLRYILSFC